MPNNVMDCMGICGLSNFVQYIMAHGIILTKCLKVNFEKLTCHNFFKFLVSIQTLM